MSTDRRTFLQLLSTGAAAAAFPTSIARALEIPASNRTGTIEDVEHIVILMQENRSFDHYFGSLKGVRGFNDPRAVKLPNGDPVWKQPDGSGGYVLPFHPPAPNLGLQFLEDLAHDWTSTHSAWNNGSHDQWVPEKSPTTMAHLTRSDIPFHYALADAFTTCDAYHCSLLGPTDPNRYHMWTGWVGNDGKAGGPVIDNAEAGYDWHTFPERMVKAGISWKCYQDVGEGLDAAHYWGWTGDNPYIGNYGDNSLLYFHQYQNAPDGSPLAEGARTGSDILANGQHPTDLFSQFRSDVKNNKLPQVTYIVPPEAYTEHPNWPANYGAWYVSQILDALTSNPEVWSKTALFLTYDENDGFFDHVVPNTPPPTPAHGKSTVNIVDEIFPGDATYPAGPYGLGARVPMVVISPWSKGGYVNSEVFDHTSLIRFIEARYAKQHPGLIETNITPWRRAVTGDLTSCFNFKSANGTKVPLPSTVAYLPPDTHRHPDYKPLPPANQAMPVQERGTRPARTLPYQLLLEGAVDLSNGRFNLNFINLGKTAVYQVRSGNSSLGPWVYTVSGRDRLFDSIDLAGNNLTAYDLSVYGPNGFYRGFQGSILAGSADLHVGNTYDSDLKRPGSFTLLVHNNGAKAETLILTDVYGNRDWKFEIAAGTNFAKSFSLEHTRGWYDFILETASDSSFRRQLAGHVESGEDSITDPAMGGVWKA